MSRPYRRSRRPSNLANDGFKPSAVLRCRRLRSLAALVLLLFPTSLGLFRGLQPEPVLHLGWTGVVKQTAANTCGPAVVATLLAWNGTDLSDMQVAQQARLDRDGVSLAEFARLSGAFGFPGRWWSAVAGGDLSRVPLPGVVHLTDNSGHFAVLLRDLGGFVQLADPARGNILLPKRLFLSSWSGRVFTFNAIGGA